MAIDKLIIHRLNFNIQLNQQEDFKPYADRISNVCKSYLSSRLDSILRKHKLPEGKLIINKIEIDLGTISPHNFETQFLKAIADALDNTLARLKPKIKQEISQSKFKSTIQRKIEITKPDFVFKSELILNKSLVLTEGIQKGLSTEKVIHLDKEIQKQIESTKVLAEKRKLKKHPSKTKVPESELSIKNVIQPAESIVLKKAAEADPSEPSQEIKGQQKYEGASPDSPKHEFAPSKEKHVIFSGSIASTSPTPKIPIQESAPSIRDHRPAFTSQELTDLDKTFFYFLKYGRLPSNVKYELGTRLKDIVKINEGNDLFLKEIDKHTMNDTVAKQRLQRVIGKDGGEFDPRVPKAFEDYFTALVFDLDMSTFSAGIGRYNINDMINFLYADSPQKLRALLRFFMLEYPSSKDLDSRITDLANKTSKASLVKILSSFVRKGAYVNKSLNVLNKDDHKYAQREVLKALLLKTKLPVNVEVKPRIFLSKEPTFEKQSYSTDELLNYFLTHGSLPYSSSGFSGDLQRLDSIIQTLSKHQIQSISFFKTQGNLKYESVGKLSEQAIQHLIKALKPDLSKEIHSHFNFFKQNIISGIPKEFQKTFMLQYANKDNRKSYLEEMVDYWKEQFGDSPKVLRNRWQLREDLDRELSVLLNIGEKSLADQLKVDYEFQNYNQDISVKNAGLVLLWPFLKIYFNMLDLLNPQGNFRSMDERARACHLLQYLAVKQSAGEEFYYPLNKILTGYPLDQPLPYEIKMTEKEVDVSNALLKNVIKQWNALKGSSVDALRGSFLIRDGILVPSPNGWLLTVEKKAYDIIMDRLPWGIGMIKLSWAPYVLNVEWDRNIM